MNQFFKVFFASLLALVVFTVIGTLIFLVFVSSVTTPEKETTGKNAVLVLDLSKPYLEITESNPLVAFTNRADLEPPSLFDVLRMIETARKDSAVKGIYISCGSNANGFAASEEIRSALKNFKNSGKFIYAYADVISQSAYHVANIADKIYCNPQGGLEWQGYEMELLFLKGALDKLEIEPQIFYAGKFKSATEPFRATKMTEPNRIQNTELLKDLYSNFLQQTAEQRGVDTATLQRYADQNLIQFASDAVTYKLVDGVRYDDQVKDEIKEKLKVGKYEKLNFISLSRYAKAADFRSKGQDKIGDIYAQGNIIDGKGERTQIGSESYRNLIRKLRLDKSIKAIVFRVNSGGGSALASENIWRELSLAREEKPVILSFGDVAASGGYYLAANADSIFALPNTITGSIGVFTLIPNLEKFFNNKLGVSFDNVSTSPESNSLNVVRPLSPVQKRFLQAGVDSIYHVFKTRVAEGRKLDMEYVDSVAQGRIWSGKKAVELGLVDRLGGLNDAIASAARMAKIDEYRVREYPERESLYEMLFGSSTETIKEKSIREEIGEDNFKVYKSIQSVKQMMNGVQARMPFDFSIR